MRKLVLLLAALLVFAPIAGADESEVRSLDGSGNNRQHPEWGKTNTQYLRVARTNYADGVARPVGGPSTRYVSNRVFNDCEPEPVLGERRHPVGLRLGAVHGPHVRPARGGGRRECADPLQRGRSRSRASRTPWARSRSLRTPAAPGTGRGRTPREQINTVSSYIDGFSVYGGTESRLEWLREGSVDGRLSNNGAKLLLQSGYLPRADARGNAAAAPPMALMGRLEAPGASAKAFVAGDVRANENIALAATHTLFALEHNRIVASAAAPAVRGGEVPDRPPRGRGGAAVHHLQRVPPGARRPAAGVPRLRRRRERQPRERVRGRRLPRAQHDPRRARVDRRGGGLHRRAAGRDRGARASRSWPRATRSSS